jgi:hypothetical protein
MATDEDGGGSDVNQETETNPLAPDAFALIERLALEFANKPELADQARKLDWLVDILVLRGHLTQNHRGMIKRITAPKRASIVLASDPGTPVPAVDIDCGALLHLCQGRCCSFNVPLSEEEVVGGKVQWDLLKPYQLKKNENTGYCCNVGADGGCSKYQERPRVCRAYDCRADVRVWLDFDKKIPSPMFGDVIPLSEWDEESEVADKEL